MWKINLYHRKYESCLRLLMFNAKWSMVKQRFLLSERELGHTNMFKSITYCHRKTQTSKNTPINYLWSARKQHVIWKLAKKKKKREREKNKAGKDLHSRSCDHEGQFV